MTLEERTVQLGDLLLDPNNYRFHDLPEWRRVSESRFHEAKVQEKAFSLLKGTTAFELAALKDSIRTNGFVPLERIVVRGYPTDESKYIVVEGNRRIAAIRWLLEDEEGGLVTLSPEETASLISLRVLFLDVSLRVEFCTFRSTEGEGSRKRKMVVNT